MGAPNTSAESTTKDQKTTAPDIIVAPPLGLDNQDTFFSSVDRELKPKGNAFSRVLDILKSVRPGSILTSFQVPAQFNLPKSQLQCFAEQLYSCGENLLDQCADGATPLDRFLAVIRWDISLTRPTPFAKAPYNPILGETHHVSTGDLNVLTEQVSHHPPISVLYATNTKEKIQVFQWNKPLPRLAGGSVEVNVEGKRTLTLAEHGETYEMTSPKLSFKFLPTVGSEWTGDTFIRCVESGLEAQVSYKPRSFLRLRGGSNRISGTVWKTSSGSKETLYTISGSWDGEIMLQDKVGKKTLLLDAKVALTNLKTPEIKSQEIPEMESLLVWSKVTKALSQENWEAARKAKISIEEEQRRLRKERAETGVAWKPQFFRQTSDGGWEWTSKGHPVPRTQAVVV